MFTLHRCPPYTTTGVRSSMCRWRDATNTFTSGHKHWVGLKTESRKLVSSHLLLTYCLNCLELYLSWKDWLYKETAVAREIVQEMVKWSKMMIKTWHFSIQIHYFTTVVKVWNQRYLCLRMRSFCVSHGTINGVKLTQRQHTSTPPLELERQVMLNSFR